MRPPRVEKRVSALVTLLAVLASSSLLYHSGKESISEETLDTGREPSGTNTHDARNLFTFTIASVSKVTFFEIVAVFKRLSSPFPAACLADCLLRVGASLWGPPESRELGCVVNAAAAVAGYAIIRSAWRLSRMRLVRIAAGGFAATVCAAGYLGWRTVSAASRRPLKSAALLLLLRAGAAHLLPPGGLASRALASAEGVPGWALAPFGLAAGAVAVFIAGSVATYVFDDQNIALYRRVGNVFAGCLTAVGVAGMMWGLRRCSRAEQSAAAVAVAFHLASLSPLSAALAASVPALARRQQQPRRSAAMASTEEAEQAGQAGVQEPACPACGSPARSAAPPLQDAGTQTPEPAGDTPVLPPRRRSTTEGVVPPKERDEDGQRVRPAAGEERPPVPSPPAPQQLEDDHLPPRKEGLPPKKQTTPPREQRSPQLKVATVYNELTRRTIKTDGATFRRLLREGHKVDWQNAVLLREKIAVA